MGMKKEANLAFKILLKTLWINTQHPLSAEGGFLSCLPFSLSRTPILGFRH